MTRNRFRSTSIALMIFAALETFSTPPLMADVPCYGPQYEASQCADPFIEGVVDQQWIGLVMGWSGGNGGVNSILVFSVGWGSNGVQTRSLGTIKAMDNYGWNGGLEARFRREKLWIMNPYHLPGETSHFGFTHMIVRQFGVYKDASASHKIPGWPAIVALKQEAIATVPCVSSAKAGCNPSDSTIANALAHASP